MAPKRGQVPPASQLALHLGELRRRACLTWRELGTRALFNHVVMWRAVNDVRPVTWPVVVAFVAVCESEIRRLEVEEHEILLDDQANPKDADLAMLKALWRADGRGRRRR